MAETVEESSKPLGENPLLRCHLINIGAGEERTITL